jgi:putrescine transport system substrate-binding protein
MPLKLCAALFAVVFAAASHSATLRILNWGDYLDPDVVKDFEAQHSVTIEYVEFNNSDEFSELFFDTNNQFDVIFPASDSVSILKDNKLIEKLDKTRFKNYQNINQVVLDGLKLQDTNNQYSVPYLWGTTGIGFNKQALKRHGIEAKDISWSLIFDKELRQKVSKCGIGVVNERDEIFSAALNYLGHSINTTDKTELKAAGALIKEAYIDFTYLHTNQYTDDLKNNKICVGVGYSGDILAQIEENPDIDYVIPSQGATMWIDVMAIPTNSPSPDLAYLFIDYLMAAASSAKNSNYAAYPTPMLDAQPLVEPEILSNKTIYPNAITLASLNMIAPSNKKVRRIKHRLWVRAICIKGKWCSVPMRSIL